MSDHISDVVSFLCKHGAEAEEIVFADGPAELTDAQRTAAELAREHALDTFETLLLEIREVFLHEMKGHRTAPRLVQGRPRRSTLREKREWKFNPVPGKMAGGVAIGTWGEPTISIYGWIWTKDHLVSAAEEAVRGVDLELPPWRRGTLGDEPQPWRNEYGSHHVTFPLDQEGRPLSEIAAHVASVMAKLVRPIADAVLASDRLARP